MLKSLGGMKLCFLWWTRQWNSIVVTLYTAKWFLASINWSHWSRKIFLFRRVDYIPAAYFLKSTTTSWTPCLLAFLLNPAAQSTRAPLLTTRMYSLLIYHYICSPAIFTMTKRKGYWYIHYMAHSTTSRAHMTRISVDGRILQFVSTSTFRIPKKGTYHIT